jgi:hypothetical protein
MTAIIVKFGRLEDFAAGRLFERLGLPKSCPRPTAAVYRKSLRVAASAVALLSLVPLLSPSPARAGVGDYSGNVLTSLQHASPVEAVQYYSLDNSNYCWYDAGWAGPGWYSCGYEWDEGLGWGGPYGWNGWGGGHRIRLHGSRGVGVWHHTPAPHVFSGGAPVSPSLQSGSVLARPGFVGSGVSHFHGVGAPASPGFAGGGAAHFHGVGGVASASPGFAGGGVPHFHSFGAPASPGFAGSGAAGFHSFGGVASASPGFVSSGAPAFHSFGGGAPGFQGLVGGAPAFHGFSVGGGFHGGGGGAFSFGGHGGGGHR